MTKTLLVWAAVGFVAITARAVQYSYADSGGTVTLGTDGATLTITAASVGSPAGTTTMSCPITYYADNEWSCAAGSVLAVD